jgi:hypothetical protein
MSENNRPTDGLPVHEASAEQASPITIICERLASLDSVDLDSDQRELLRAGLHRLDTIPTLWRAAITRGKVLDRSMSRPVRTALEIVASFDRDHMPSNTRYATGRSAGLLSPYLNRNSGPPRRQVVSSQATQRSVALALGIPLEIVDNLADITHAVHHGDDVAAQFAMPQDPNLIEPHKRSGVNTGIRTPTDVPGVSAYLAVFAWSSIAQPGVFNTEPARSADIMLTFTPEALVTTLGISN